LQAFPILIRKAEDELTHWVEQLPGPGRDTNRSNPTTY
jgi:hypothetical protein